MTRSLIIFTVFHFIGMVVYIAAVDKYQCGDFHYDTVHDCYGWKGSAGVWEVIVLQEFVIKPLLP